MAAQDRLEAIDEAEANRLIDSGSCDAYAVVESCPAYAEHRARIDALALALEPCQ